MMDVFRMLIIGVCVTFVVVVVSRFVFAAASSALKGSSSNIAGGGGRLVPTLLVIAHPDDEAMFFVPTLRALAASRTPTHILCLCTGDYDRLGARRRGELFASARRLGIEGAAVHIVDRPGTSLLS
jgi:N-acetylglucosaminylphosphatidylinositol deacetylase